MMCDTRKKKIQFKDYWKVAWWCIWVLPRAIFCWLRGWHKMTVLSRQGSMIVSDCTTCRNHFATPISSFIVDRLGNTVEDDDEYQVGYWEKYPATVFPIRWVRKLARLR